MNVTSPKDYIQQRFINKGFSQEELRVPERVYVLFPAIFKLLLNQGFNKKKHPLFGTVFYENNKYFVNARCSSAFMATLVEELVFLGAKEITYYGFAGSIMKEINIGDFLVSTGAYNETGVGVIYGYEWESFIPAHKEYTQEFKKKLLNQKISDYGVDIKIHEGAHWCTDALYRESSDKIKKYSELGALCVEMECAGLFSVAEKHKIKASCVLYITDQILNNKWTIGDLRQSVSFQNILKFLI